MDTGNIILGVLVAWLIIKGIEISWAYRKRKAIVNWYPFNDLSSLDDKSAKEYFELPADSMDPRLILLWTAMTKMERQRWHRDAKLNNEHEQRLDKQEQELSKHDRSTEDAERMYQTAYTLYERDRERIWKNCNGRIDNLVKDIRERLDDEARVIHYMSNKALLQHQESNENAKWIRAINASHYLKEKKHEKNYGTQK